MSKNGGRQPLFSNPKDFVLCLIVSLTFGVVVMTYDPRIMIVLVFVMVVVLALMITFSEVKKYISK